MRNRRFMLLAVVLVTLNAFFWLAPGGLAFPRNLVDQFFGSRVIRAEVLVETPSGPVDYFLDRGVIKTVTPASIVIKEQNGEMVSIQISSTVSVTGRGGRAGSAAALRRGLRVTVLRQANAPAEIIQVDG